MNAYQIGFIKRAQQYGFTQEQAIALLKHSSITGVLGDALEGKQTAPNSTVTNPVPKKSGNNWWSGIFSKNTAQKVAPAAVQPAKTGPAAKYPK